MTPKNCPKCGVGFEKEDIFQYFFELTGDEEKALDHASFYGWSKENPQCFSRCIALYNLELDKTTQWQCPDCKYVWDRI
jgi:rubredoxin